MWKGGSNRNRWPFHPVPIKVEFGFGAEITAHRVWHIRDSGPVFLRSISCPRKRGVSREHRKELSYCGASRWGWEGPGCRDPPLRPPVGFLPRPHPAALSPRALSTCCVFTFPWAQPCLQPFGNAWVTWLKAGCRQGCLVTILPPSLETS